VYHVGELHQLQAVIMRVLHGWDWWRSIGAPRHVCAPMVDQSERAFRALCRELGTDLGYTPMLHARLFTEVSAYREMHFDANREEGRVIAQLAGHDPPTVLQAARMIQSDVDAIDLNFGCPQAIARKGRYGAFLLDEPDVMVSLVDTLARGLDVPVTAKLRLLPSRPASLDLCKRLEDAGASALTLHGRTREQNKQHAGVADWDAIAQTVQHLGIPVIANGGIATADDVEACFEHTGAAAVMSSEALLENPALFCRNVDPADGRYLDQNELARRYLGMCRAHPPTKGVAMVRGHLFKLLHNGLRLHPEMRDELLITRTLTEMEDVTERLAAKGWEQPAFHTAHAQPDHSWYARHITAARQRSEQDAASDNAAGNSPPSQEDVAAAALAKRERKKQERRQRNKNRRNLGRSGRKASRAALLQ
jgi:tRNA-dihydrouridine synthase 1